jgi:hypothetical protein
MMHDFNAIDFNRLTIILNINLKQNVDGQVKLYISLDMPISLTYMFVIVKNTTIVVSTHSPLKAESIKLSMPSKQSK